MAGSLPPGPSAPRLIQTARWMRRPVEFMEGCRSRYGETFTGRFTGGRTMVMTAEPEVAKRVFSADRENTPPTSRHIEPVMGRRSVMLLEGEEHTRRRRLMLPAFHGERMRAYESMLREITEREIDSWPLGEPFSLHPRMQAITLEVILRAVFGVSDAERLGELRDPLVQILNMTVSPSAKGLGRVARRLGPVARYQRGRRLLDRSDALLAQEIARRREDPSLAEREDVLSNLMAARFEDGRAMGDAELRDQLMTLLVVGHETTATALAWCFDLLLHHPEAMERLRGEASSNGKDYLNAVIQEALRVRPVIPVVGRRLGSGLEVDGYPLPAGTDVVICIYLIHTRPDLYPDPQEFRPERFLGGGPSTYAWLPFGGGTRRCLGGAFAEFEMRSVLRAVLARTTLRPGSEAPERITRRNVTFSPEHGTPVVLEDRRTD